MFLSSISGVEYRFKPSLTLLITCSANPLARGFRAAPVLCCIPSNFVTWPKNRDIKLAPLSENTVSGTEKRATISLKNAFAVVKAVSSGVGTNTT